MFLSLDSGGYWSLGGASIKVMSSVDLHSIWSEAISGGGSVAVWRLPHTDQFHILADMQPSRGMLDVDKSDFGFAISPFLNSDGTETIFLKDDIYAVFNADELSDFNTSAEYHVGSCLNRDVSGNREHFLKMVESGMHAIADAKFDKVVPARTLDIPLPDSFNLLKLFAEISANSPNAFVSLISIPEIGTWMGATPEMLIESTSRYFRTVSLAGTQAFVEGMDLSMAAWTQKEIEEQAMVSRYVIEQFKTIRLRAFIEKGPRTIRAGSMIHLKSEYYVDLDQVEFVDLGSRMLRLLHPTSAVCGMPREAALKFIIENEGINRELYSGFLGPVNKDGVTQLYVNLRCMQLLDSTAVLYAGAGVTYDSIPEKEWDETMLKCHTLLDLFNHE